MKEFPHKLSASGWDIGQIKTHPTTGFSGTNDSKKVLPLPMGQLEGAGQQHTNALVLGYLLQPENSVVLMPPRKGTSSSDAELLLALVKDAKPAIQVILDVGAQVLELSNIGVAREWLKMSCHEVQAAIFFDDNDELSVLDRRGNIEVLQTSPFAKQLDVCIVFLDEAHTRGTDLKLPPNYRAAVTLGPNLTKDRLVQACMRMRNLGNGQSVIFCIPPEIKAKILARSSGPENMTIEVLDVLVWAISETRIDVQRSMPLWRAQGLRFEDQAAIWSEYESDTLMEEHHASKFLKDEAQSLEHRYRPCDKTAKVFSTQASQNKNVMLIEERCREFVGLDIISATLQEEQERELSPEIEQERQVQKPAPAKPAEHSVHPDLDKFVSMGVLISGSKAYKPAFEALNDISAASHLDVREFPRDLLVSADFASTVQVSGKSYISDEYQRPVQWILTISDGKGEKKNTVTSMMVISPFEANALLQMVQNSKCATLHVYSPRQNRGFATLDNLDLYSDPARPQTPILPPHLIIQLNLFSGQLYFNSFEEYVDVCDFLGLAWGKTTDGVAADGFILKNISSRQKSSCKFTRSPVKFLKVLMTKIRRNCEGVDKTDMGKILDGRILLRSDFEKEGE